MHQTSCKDQGFCQGHFETSFTRHSTVLNLQYRHTVRISIPLKQRLTSSFTIGIAIF